MNKRKLGHLEPITPQQAFGITSIDVIRPFSKTKNENVYAVSIQCELTKFVIIIPVPNKEATGSPFDWTIKMFGHRAQDLDSTDSQSIGECKRNERIGMNGSNIIVFVTTTSVAHHYSPFELVFAHNPKNLIIRWLVWYITYYQEVRYRLQLASKGANAFISRSRNGIIYD